MRSQLIHTRINNESKGTRIFEVPSTEPSRPNANEYQRAKRATRSPRALVGQICTLRVDTH